MKRLLACLLLAVLLQTSSTARAALPNFVVIFIDDMGYGDIEPFGSKINKTPHLNRMAREGRRLTSFYVASPVCTPSRAALMTGCYPQRVGLEKGSGHIVLFPGDHHGLHPDEITIAETLRAAGYATGCFGKWHLGDQPQFLPTAQGFDTYYGIPYSNDMWPYHPGVLHLPMEQRLKKWTHLPLIDGNS
ncbi:MAG: sulfatase-like hydrolase/transferase, partial [Pirellulaceae bacterium]|nr:sulfatase-like hydrolase/transferase [Pirellulaceae bacterium]